MEKKKNRASDKVFICACVVSVSRCSFVWMKIMELWFELRNWAKQIEDVFCLRERLIKTRSEKQIEWHS